MSGLAGILSHRTVNTHVTVSRTVILRRKQGLHLRVASQVIALVKDFTGDVRINHGDKSADASSMFELIQLIALPDSQLEVVATGDNAEAIVGEIVELFSRPTDDAPPAP